MLTRRNRIASHAVAAVLLAGVAVVATGAGAGAASSASRPESFGGAATSGSMQFRVDRSPLPIPAVSDPFHLWVPYAETSIDSSTRDTPRLSAASATCCGPRVDRVSRGELLGVG